MWAPGALSANESAEQGDPEPRGAGVGAVPPEAGPVEGVVETGAKPAETEGSSRRKDTQSKQTLAGNLEI